MAEGVNVRLSGKLQDFVKLKSDPEQGIFASASEYIRDLIRHDYEREEARKWSVLNQELADGLADGLAADESEFIEAMQIQSSKKRGGTRQNQIGA